LISKLIESKAKKIYTDGLNIYPTLIPKSIHSVYAKCTNRIERLNLTMRTHIRRLSRKTLCFSRSRLMLEAGLTLYFGNCI
jgi:insertion element IS1 protein InsB